MSENSLTLLEWIASPDNLNDAFFLCKKNKRSSPGYQELIGNTASRLSDISHKILEKDFKWAKYRKFYVSDPKRRLIMSAPFKDRIVHTAICRVLDPFLDSLLSSKTFACRKKMGSRNAVCDLQRFLSLRGRNWYAIKLDVCKYFDNIGHAILLLMLKEAILKSRFLEEEKVDCFLLIEDLLLGHEEAKKLSKGIPIGNLTSQLFANFYLKDADRLACEMLGLSYKSPSYFNIKDFKRFSTMSMDEKTSVLKEEGIDFTDTYYIRYMDDFVFIAKDKDKALRAANRVQEFVREHLNLEISYKKKGYFKNVPIPFLGFLVDETSSKPLSKNRRRFIRKYKSCTDQLDKRILFNSYGAWARTEL